MQKAYFPMDYLRVTQGRGVGSHAGTYALDFGGKDTGSDPVFAPCDMVVKRVRTDAGNNGEVYAQSTGPVAYPDGGSGYIHFTFIHDNQYNANVAVGNVIRQGTYFYDEGGKSGGRAGVYGTHLHLEVGRGTSPQRQVKNSAGCWMTPGTEPMENLLWLRPDCQLLAGGGYTWQTDAPAADPATRLQPVEETLYVQVTAASCQVFHSPDVNDTALGGAKLPVGDVYPVLAMAQAETVLGTGHHGPWVQIAHPSGNLYLLALTDRTALLHRLPQAPEKDADCAGPDTPEAPVEPVTPQAPAEPEVPVGPEAPAEAEAPAKPEAPPEPETPAAPLTPQEESRPTGLPGLVLALLRWLWEVLTKGGAA